MCWLSFFQGKSLWLLSGNLSTCSMLNNQMWVHQQEGYSFPSFHWNSSYFQGISSFLDLSLISCISIKQSFYVSFLNFSSCQNTVVFFKKKKTPIFYSISLDVNRNFCPIPFITFSLVAHVSLLVVQSLSCVRTICDPMDCSSPGFSFHRIRQAKLLEWVAISSSRGSSPPRD